MAFDLHHDVGHHHFGADHGGDYHFGCDPHAGHHHVDDSTFVGDPHHPVHDGHGHGYDHGRPIIGHDDPVMPGHGHGHSDIGHDGHDHGHTLQGDHHTLPHHEPHTSAFGGIGSSHGHTSPFAGVSDAASHHSPFAAVTHDVHHSPFAATTHHVAAMKVGSLFGGQGSSHDSGIHGSFTASGGTKSGIDVGGCIGKPPVQICGEYHNQGQSSWTVGVNRDVGGHGNVGVSVGHGSGGGHPSVGVSGSLRW